MHVNEKVIQIEFLVRNSSEIWLTIRWPFTAPEKPFSGAEPHHFLTWKSPKVLYQWSTRKQILSVASPKFLLSCLMTEKDKLKEIQRKKNDFCYYYLFLSFVGFSLSFEQSIIHNLNVFQRNAKNSEMFQVLRKSVKLPVKICYQNL